MKNDTLEGQRSSKAGQWVLIKICKIRIFTGGELLTTKVKCLLRDYFVSCWYTSQALRSTRLCANLLSRISHIAIPVKSIG